MYITHLSCT